jgi:membrane-bound inhibitor of C-type lysozyme
MAKSLVCSSMISCKSAAIDIAMLLEENGKAQNSNPRYQCGHA